MAENQPKLGWTKISAGFGYHRQINLRRSKMTFLTSGKELKTLCRKSSKMWKYSLLIRSGNDCRS
jgi:hypothetical protein